MALHFVKCSYQVCYETRSRTTDLISRPKTPEFSNFRENPRLNQRLQAPLLYCIALKSGTSYFNPLCVPTTRGSWHTPARSLTANPPVIDPNQEETERSRDVGQENRESKDRCSFHLPSGKFLLQPYQYR